MVAILAAILAIVGIAVGAVMAGVTLSHFGTFLVGFGTVLIAATPFILRMNKKLNSINGAVNNKQKDEPTLRELAVETAGHLGELRGLLEAHTKQDGDNFIDLRARMEVIARQREASAQTIAVAADKTAADINEGNQIHE